MKVSFITLGCKVNQFESQAMAALLQERGHLLALEGEAADAYVINTCAVTGESSRKSRQAVRHAMSENPDAITAVCGCWAQISPEEAEKLGSDLVFGSSDRHELVEALERCFDTRRHIVNVDDAMERSLFEALPAGSGIGRTRAMLKVQDGCHNFCTYCIIPYARGPVRSLPPEEAVYEVKRLAAEGYRELVITGIEISSYGFDLDGINLIDLVERLCFAAPQMRVRLGSLEPRTVTAEFCERLSKLTNFCPHFHLSLQSGSAATLKRMGRRYSPQEFFAGTELLRESFPNCGITTDLIVGFPGETEEEFEETLSFIKKCAFSAMHVFPYSKRPGTEASEMPNQLTNIIKKERAKRAADVACELRCSFLKAQVGTVQEVLFEASLDGLWSGLTGNYCEVRVSGTAIKNEISGVKITGTSRDYLIGEII